MPLCTAADCMTRYLPNTSTIFPGGNRLRAVAAYLVAASSVLLIGTTSAQELAFTSGEWTGHVLRASDGAVEFCNATNRRPDQYPRLYIGIYSNGETVLSAVNKNWGPWKDDATVPVRLTVDGRSVSSSDAYAVDEYGLMIAPDRKQLTAAIKDGSRIAVETAHGTTSLAVNGVTELFAMLESCAAGRQSQSKTPVGEMSAANARVTVLTCQLNLEHDGSESLPSAYTSRTMTVSFEEQSQRILNRGAVKSVKFTDTEISWMEPLSDERVNAYKIERFSGAITMYVSDDGDRKQRVAGRMTSLANGTCEVTKDRLF